MPAIKEQPTLSGETLEEKMTCLYERARIANELFGQWLEAVKVEGGFDDAKIVHPPLKGRATATAKLTRGGERKKPESLTDIVRATMSFPDLASLYRGANMIQRSVFFNTMKDRFRDSVHDLSKEYTRDGVDFKGAQGSGYRDMNLSIKMAITHEGRVVDVLCELQLNIAVMLVAKELEHPAYEITRRETPRDTWLNDADNGLLNRRMVGLARMECRVKQGLASQAARDLVDFIDSTEPNAGRARIAVVPLDEIVDRFGAEPKKSDRKWRDDSDSDTGASAALEADDDPERARDDLSEFHPGLAAKFAIVVDILRQRSGMGWGDSSARDRFAATQRAMEGRIELLNAVRKMRDDARSLMDDPAMAFTGEEIEQFNSVAQKLPRQRPVAAELTREQINARLRGADIGTFQSLDVVFFYENDIVKLNALLPKLYDMFMLAAMNMKKKGKDGRWVRGIGTKEYLEMKKSKR